MEGDSFSAIIKTPSTAYISAVSAQHRVTQQCGRGLGVTASLSLVSAPKLSFVLTTSHLAPQAVANYYPLGGRGMGQPHPLLCNGSLVKPGPRGEVGHAYGGTRNSVSR